MTNISSTPPRPKSHSTKAIRSDDHPSPSPSNQDTMKTAVGHELDGYTWQFDASRLAKVLHPKIRKLPLEPDEVDNLNAYNYDTIPKEVLQNAVAFFGPLPTFPDAGGESDHYQPLCDVLNKCVEACHKALGESKGKYYRGLKFVHWDNPTQDGCPGEHRLKPDLVGGINLPERDEIKANGGLYWRRPGTNEHELLIPVEVKKVWKDLVRQAGTYARCLLTASPLRKFALVLGYEYDLREFRLLVFHHGGLTSSQALKFNTEQGINDLLHIFLAILSWNTVYDAGLPLWCNDKYMFLPGEESPVQVKKVLHQSLSVRGRCAQVVLVSKVDGSDKRNESKPDLTIPAPNSQRRSQRLQLQSIDEVAAPDIPKSKTSTASKLRSTDEKESTGSKLRSRKLGVKDKPISLSVEADNEKPLDNGRTVEDVTQNVIELTSKSSFTSPGTVVKCSWVSLATKSVESELLHDCSGLFGTPKHYYSFLACHGNNSPATNHLFLPDGAETESCYWNLFCTDARSPERRGLWVYVSTFTGHSLVTARSSKALIHAAFHACLGWFNLIQKGYLHRDISIGNLVMVEDAVTTEAFKFWKNEGRNATVEDITETLEDLKIDSSTTATLEDKLSDALLGLGITNKCQGFVIDGDMAIKMSDYFDMEHPGSRSGTYQFMSDDMLTAAEYRRDYLQSPVDDLYSFYYTMQWAAAFHDQEFAAEDIPFGLKLLREKLLGNQMDRYFVSGEITSPSSISQLEFGSVLAQCQPVLRAWYSKLQGIKEDWKKCQFKLRGQETKAEIYIPLFSTFALRGVATLAEIVYNHTKDMD